MDWFIQSIEDLILWVKGKVGLCVIKFPFITFTHQRVKLELQDPEHTVCIQAALFENKKLFCYIPMVKNEKLKALEFVY